MPYSDYADPSLFYRDYVDAIVYLFSVLIAVGMVSWRIARREHFKLRIIVCAAFMVAFICGVTYPIQLVTLDGNLVDYQIWFHTLKFFAVFIFSGIAVKVCFDCDWWAALFCATAGYCMQHINARINSLIQDVPLSDSDWAVKLVVSILVIAVVYLLFYIFILRYSPKIVVVRVTERWQVVLAVCVVGVSVCYNSFGVSYAYQVVTYFQQNGIDSFLGYDILIFNYVMSLIIAVLILALEFGNYRNKELSLERDLLKQMLAEKKAQYESEKHNIELINIKCHDIKHQLNSLKGVVYDEQLSELSRAVSIYDNSIKTGSDALDVVLRQKSLYCDRNNIRLTCMVDGAKLSFIPEHEQYSLFCNVIDNAIDGVAGLPEDKRVISITECIGKDKYIIRAENYYEGKRNFSGDLPSTTKHGEGHGYGMKSMRMIVENNGGALVARAYDDIFVTEFIFDLSKLNKNVSNDDKNAAFVSCV